MDAREARERRCESRGGGEKGELATITHKDSFSPRKHHDAAKRENCHCNCAAAHVLLQLLPTLSTVLDGQLLILHLPCCHVHVSEFFYAVNFNQANKPMLEGSA